MEKGRGVYSVPSPLPILLRVTGMWNVGGTVRKVIKLTEGHDIHCRRCEARRGRSSVVNSEVEQMS